MQKQNRFSDATPNSSETTSNSAVSFGKLTAASVAAAALVLLMLQAPTCTDDSPTLRRGHVLMAGCPEREHPQDCWLGRYC